MVDRTLSISTAKLERTLAMLLRLRRLRQRAIAD
jgi:hypothetical protein